MKWGEILIEQVLDIAQEAGEAILAIYNGSESLQITLKEDQTPLTVADLAADQLISARLTELYPDIPILSEESQALPFSERQSWRRYWLVDPLDGTREFIHRTGDFTVNIALIVDHIPVLGVVYAPFHGISYYAEQGQPAFKCDAKGLIKAIQVRPLARIPTVMVSRFHNSERLAQRLEDFGKVEVIAMGSALKPCVIAEGQADLYIRLGPTSEWDTAASQCILTAAGGGLFDLSGKTLCYNTKDILLNPAFIAAGDLSIHWLDRLRLEQ